MPRRKRAEASPPPSEPTPTPTPTPTPPPTSTTDPAYEAWLAYVCAGEGFVAPATESLKVGEIPTVQPLRVIPLVSTKDEDGRPVEMFIEQVLGVGIGAPSREALDERRDGVLLGKEHGREAAFASMATALAGLQAGTPTTRPAADNSMSATPSSNAGEPDAEGRPAGGGADNKVTPVAPSVDEEDLAILLALRKVFDKGRRLNQEQIAAQTKPRISLRTVNRRMPRLIAAGLAALPGGKKRGYVITLLGCDLTSKNTSSSAS